MVKPPIDYVDLVGVSFAYQGRGPDAYDCYGLLKELHRRQGIALPDYQTPADGNGMQITAMMACQMGLWEARPPGPGAVVLIRLHGNSHVALMVDELNMIHTWDGAKGVVVERIDVWKHRIQGFYNYVG